MSEAAPQNTAIVALVKTQDRAEGVRRVIELLGCNPVNGKTVFLKPNFNSADPAPGSTHNTTLEALVDTLWTMGATSITVGDRSGMGNTRRVMEEKGIFAMAKRLGFDVVALDELSREQWEVVQFPSSYWQGGFPLPEPALRADTIVQTCCLKTHRFGGHFTMSLKNSIGLVAKYLPGSDYNYMAELHSSPKQREMIADVNAAYETDLVVMDGAEAFVRGGPDRGDLADPGVFLASTDRVAIDAVGVAILRQLGTTAEVSRGHIFDLGQIARAAELRVGVTTPQEIKIITDDPGAAKYAEVLRQFLEA